mmetsp:Transcript_11238/g.24188  ORF Transcript_11238/g.24188 Transcript_11238/m.24188 type:complete len:206 (-) Transcript_11238:1226-1843(-)
MHPFIHVTPDPFPSLQRSMVCLSNKSNLSTLPAFPPNEKITRVTKALLYRIKTQHVSTRTQFSMASCSSCSVRRVFGTWRRRWWRCRRWDLSFGFSTSLHRWNITLRWLFITTFFLNWLLFATLHISSRGTRLRRRPIGISDSAGLAFGTALQSTRIGRSSNRGGTADHSARSRFRLIGRGSGSVVSFRFGRSFWICVGVGSRCW